MRKALLTTLIILFFSSSITPALAYDPRYLFTDQEKDFESGLYNFDAREYNPSTGRFLQQDPSLMDIQSKDFFIKNNNQKIIEKFLSNPQNLNPYSYTINNPVNYVDPTGEVGVPAAIVLWAFSGIFLSSIKIAYSPSYNSTPPVIESKDFGDMVPGWNRIPKLGRFGLGLMFGGFKNKVESRIINIAERLATKLDSELATSIARNIENGFVKMYRGVSAEEYGKVMDNGFQTFKFVTTDITEALAYAADKGLGARLITMKVPLKLFEKLLNNSGLIKGSVGEEFLPTTNNALKILNNYINK